MKILLINPCCAAEEGRDLYTNDVAGALFTMQPLKKVELGMPLALPTLAAHTPSCHDVAILDEEIESIDFDRPVDLVGITAMSYKAKRAYEIAHEFRKRGINVVLGGIHASMCPDEALRYVDCVVVGEAEDIWETLLADAQNGRLERIYKADGYPDLQRSRIPRYDLVKNRRYLYTYLQTTRGCPFDCKFCTVTLQNGRNVRKKRPEQVIAELDALLKLHPKKEFVFRDPRDGRRKKHSGNIAFIDDNFAIDRDHALAVCTALKRYQEENGCMIAWYTQVNINIGFDEDLLAAMAESNCFHVFVGIESIDPAVLKKMNKKMNAPNRYAEAIANIQRHGIRVIASTIIGEDGTSWDGVVSLKSFLEENNLLHVLINILTPYPGTAILDEYVRDKRLLTRNPQKYNIRNVVFKPEGISKEQLEEMYVWLCRSIFNCRASYRRGKALLGAADRLSLPFLLRLPALAGYLFTLLFLTLRGRVRPGAAFWALYRIPLLMLFNGSFYAMEVISMCLDFDDFARREEKRFLNKSLERIDEFDLLCPPRPIVSAISRNGKPYKSFYLDGNELRRYGYPVTGENFHRPVLLLCGTSIPLSYRRGLIQSFLESGCEVASMENPTGTMFDSRVNPVEQRPEALKDYLAYLRSARGIGQITVVAQSYSAFELIRVLLEDPLAYKDFIACIILVNPPGFDENLSMSRLVFRSVWEHVCCGYVRPASRHPDPIGFRKKERAGIVAWTARTIAYAAGRLREGHDMVHYRLKSPLKALQDQGYTIGFFLQTGDRVVPAHITLQQAMQIVPKERIKCVEGGHNDLFFQEWQRKSLIDFHREMTRLRAEQRL